MNGRWSALRCTEYTREEEPGKLPAPTIRYFLRGLVGRLTGPRPHGTLHEER